MHLIAHIAPPQKTRWQNGLDAQAYLTSTNSGWLLNMVMCVGGQHLVGGKLVNEELQPLCEATVYARLTDLAKRLSNDSSQVSPIGVHVEEAACSLALTLRRRRPAGQTVLSARQLRISTTMLGSRLGSPLHIPQVAQACGISEGHLRRAFRTCTGLSPRQWRQERRLQFCQRKLIETDAPLAVISREAGFAVQSHFSRVFTNSTGLTPSRWRCMFQSLAQARRAVHQDQASL